MMNELPRGTSSACYEEAAQPRLRNPMRSSIWIAIFIGSTIGGMIPGLWGDGIFSYSSVLLSGVGAFAGLWLVHKISA
jgi:dipeptide/tripeptide permease